MSSGEVSPDHPSVSRPTKMTNDEDLDKEKFSHSKAGPRKRYSFSSIMFGRLTVILFLALASLQTISALSDEEKNDLR